MSTKQEPQAPFDSAWRRRVEAYERFEELWQSSLPPSIIDFIAGLDAEEQRERLFELIRIDWEYRWRRGERRQIEQYAAEHPEIGPPESLPAELIADEYQMRAASGERLEESEWERRFPGRRAEWLAELARRGHSHRDSAARLGNSTTDPTSCEEPTRAAPDESRSGAVDRESYERLESKSREFGHGGRRTVGRYELRGELGRGGFATVYRAWDPTLCREVALKLLHVTLGGAAAGDDRLQREARSAARLRHPAIVPIHEVGQQDGVPFIVYELLPGPTLAQAIRDVHVSPTQAAAWIERLADALDFAHQNGIVHRDVKPANILLDRDGLPTLADFGLALDAEALATLTQHGDILGTPAYMSPEQAAGRGHEVDGRSDVYSLGVVFYELLCGRPPFQGNVSSVIQQVLHAEADRPGRWRKGVPTDLETICLKAMSREPRQRYASAGAMAADLRAFLAHRPIAARRTGLAGRTSRWLRRNPLLATTIGTALVALATLGAISYWRVTRERDRYLAERESAVANLYESLEREARAIRLARRTGYRNEAWERLRRARTLDTPRRDDAALRQEALASLGDFAGRTPVEWVRPKSLGGWISAVAAHPREPLAAVAFTDVVQLRDLRTGRVLAEFREHRAGVFALAFSADGLKLVSMDDAGRIVVRRRAAGESRASDPAASAPNTTNGWNVEREIDGEASAERHMVVAVSCFLAPDGAELFACSKGEPRVRRWNLTTGEMTGEFQGADGELFVRAALSTDGALLVGAYRAADWDGVIVWDVAERRMLKKTPVSRQGIVDVCFSGDGSQLACACTDGVVVLEVADWERRAVVRADDQFFTVAFHPHRPLLAVPNQREGRIRVWDVAANQEVATLEHPGMPHSVAFTPDGAILISAGNDSTRIWDLHGAGEKLVTSAHRGVVNHVKFSPDGRILASAGGDTYVVLHDGESLRTLGKFRASDSLLAKVQRAEFAPDGRSLAVVDWHGDAVVHDVADPAAPHPVRRLLHSDDSPQGQLLFDVQFDSAGSRIAVAGESGVLLWKHGDDEPRKITDEPTVAVRFFPDGRRLLMRRRAGGGLFEWREGGADASAGASSWSSVARVGSFLFAPDGRLLTRDGRSETDGGPRLRRTNPDDGTSEALSWRELPRLVSELDLRHDFAISRDGGRLVIGGNQLTVWDLASRRLLAVLPAEHSPATTFDLSPDGARVAIGLSDGGVVLWNLTVIERELAPFE